MSGEAGMLDIYLNDTGNVQDRLLNPPSLPPPPPPESLFLPSRSQNQDLERHQSTITNRTKLASSPATHYAASRGSSVKGQNIKNALQNYRRQPLTITRLSESNKRYIRKTVRSDSGRQDGCCDERAERALTYLASSDSNHVHLNTPTMSERDRTSLRTTIADIPSRPRSVASTGHTSKHHEIRSSRFTPSQVDNQFARHNNGRTGTQHVIDSVHPSQSSQPQPADIGSRAVINRQDTSEPNNRFSKSHVDTLTSPLESLVNLKQACISSPGAPAELPTSTNDCASHGSDHLKNDPSLTSADSQAEVSLSNDESEYGTFSREGRKKMLLDRLMSYFLTVLLPSLSDPFVIQRGAGGHDGGTQGASDTLSSTAMTSSQSSSLKRNEGKRISGDSGGGRSGRGGGQKKRRTSSPNNTSTAPAFACPYIKRDSRRYWKLCPLRGWETVHRVKQHLYRSHKQPITCPRCHEKFDTIPLRDEHLIEETRCEKRTKPGLEGFDLAQEQRLRRRQKSYDNEADNWRDVYMVLFPDTDISAIPSPYVNLHSDTETVGVVEPSVSRYEQFLSQELPKIVERELETQVNLALKPLEESLKIQLIEIVKKAQRTAHDKFMSANPDPTKPPTNAEEAERSIALEKNKREAVGEFGVDPVLSFENAPGGAEDSGNFLLDLSLGAGPSSRQEATLYELGSGEFEDDIEDVDLDSLAIPEFNAGGLEWMAQPVDAWPGLDDITDGTL